MQKPGLIKKIDKLYTDVLPQELFNTAYNIEQALLLAGAKPGIDYKLLDLFKLAQPYVSKKSNLTEEIGAEKVLLPNNKGKFRQFTGWLANIGEPRHEQNKLD